MEIGMTEQCAINGNLELQELKNAPWLKVTITKQCPMDGN